MFRVSSARVRQLILILILKIESIETMNATADPSANFRLVIVQTELERFKFLIRSLLRARMAKVCTISSGLSTYNAKHSLLDRRLPTPHPRSLPSFPKRSVSSRVAISAPPPTPSVFTLQHCFSLFLPYGSAEAGRHSRWNQHDR
jgi:hypothetical protein